MAFRFRLERVLRLRERQRDERRREHAAIQAQVEHTRRQHEQLRAQREALGRALAEGEAVTALQLATRLRSVQLASSAQRDCFARLRGLEQELARSLVRLQDAHREVQVLERLREKREGEYRDAIRAQAQRELDDIPRRRGSARAASAAAPRQATPAPAPRPDQDETHN